MNKLRRVIFLSLLSLSLAGMVGLWVQTNITYVYAQMDVKPLKNRILENLFTAPAGSYVPDRIVVRFRSYAQNRAEVLHGSGIINLGVRSLVKNESALDEQKNTYVVKLRPNEDIERAVVKLLNNPDVIYAEPDYIARPDYIPNDQFFQQHRQWSLGSTPPGINAQKAWDLWKGDGQTIVAIVDQGVDIAHPDLINQIDSASDKGYCSFHATLVAGNAAAQTDNNLGIASIGFNLKILNQNACTLTYSEVAQKIDSSVAAGAKVVNMSLGGEIYGQTLADAVTGAWNQGVVVVASAGNCGEGCPSQDCSEANVVQYPAALPEVIGVAAINSNGQRACFSTKQSYVELTAPGRGVWSSAVGGSYAAWSGTSASSPMVAGLAGLLYSLPRFSTRSTANAQAIRNYLKTTAYDLGHTGYDSENGYGLIDAFAALQAAGANGVTPTPTPTPALPTDTPVPTPPLFCSAADINQDGRVDQLDLEQIMAGWDLAQFDLNGDGIVNGAEASIVFACWTG